MKFKNITSFTLMLLFGPIVSGQCIQDCVGDTARFGQAAGLCNMAKQVSIFGRSAGLENEGEFNSFFGYSVGRNATGENNSFFGHDSGYNTTSGENNSFYSGIVSIIARRERSQ